MSEISRFKHNEIHGAGIGLRSVHYQEVFDTQPDVPWFELLSDNYMADGGLPLVRAEKIREDYPITLHGVGMSLGSVDPLNVGYLARLKKLAARLEPTYVSDHLAWVSVNGQYTHDLMPIPYTEETLKLVSARIRQAQDILGRRLLIENPSAYMTFKSTVMPEWEFIQGIVDETDCDLLLDVNNIYVSAINHSFDPYEYISFIPLNRVKEIHLAGYKEMDKYLFDTHGHRVHPPVWDLYCATIKRLGAIPTLIEWDNEIPSFAALREEAAKADERLREVM